MHTIVLLVIIFIIAFFITSFFKHKSENAERLILIEKGVDYSDLPPRSGFHFSFPWIKIGIVIISIAIGMALGTVLHEELGLEEEYAYAVLFLCGGIGLIVAHYVGKPDEKNEI